MSTKAIRELIERTKEKALEIRASSIWWPDAGIMADKALLELDEIERMAKDLTRLYIGDFTGNVAHREHVVAAITTPESQWTHPDVKAWSDAAVLLEKIAKEAK